MAKPRRAPPAGFQKGVSGNPGGKPKQYYEMRKLARDYSAEH